MINTENMEIENMTHRTRNWPAPKEGVSLFVLAMKASRLLPSCSFPDERDEERIRTW